MALIIYSLLIDAYTIDKIYEDLSRNAAFKELSPLEIAIDRDDAEAIQHFAPTADRQSIIKAIDQLKAQIDFAYQKIEDLERIAVYHLGEDVRRKKQRKQYKRITELTNLIESLKRRL
jgi:hypothetical protein